MEDKLQDIINAIAIYHADGSDKKASLFISGNTELQKAITDMKGDRIVLAETFGNSMQNNIHFNRIMKALFGSYLSQHPEEKEEFIRGLDMTKITPSMN